MLVPSSKLLLTAASLLVGAATAIPAPAPAPTPAVVPLEARADDDATGVWVTVDKTGLPSTVTPVVTVSDGSATTISAIPTVLTATVLTRTAYGELTTSYGTSPAYPTATNKAGAGAFLTCSNTDGEYAPFCEPGKNSSFYPGKTYYVTWDPSVINGTKLNVIGTYINATTGEPGDQAFTSDTIRKSWSYYAWTPSSGMLKKGSGSAVNISLSLNVLASDEETVTKTYAGPVVLVTKAPTYHQKSPTLPKGAALYIGLPVVFGFCLVMVCGVCAWNRKARTIGLGNIMSRGRHGYGVAKSRARRMTMRSGGLGRKQKQAMNIRLMDQVPEEDMYRDEPRVEQKYYQQQQQQQQRQPPQQQFDFNLDDGHSWNGPGHGHARRDSDALGSLAGTPTSEQFPRQQQQHAQGSGNAFRDELERQRQERY